MVEYTEQLEKTRHSRPAPRSQAETRFVEIMDKLDLRCLNAGTSRDSIDHAGVPRSTLSLPVLSHDPAHSVRAPDFIGGYVISPSVLGVIHGAVGFIEQQLQ